MGYSAYDLFDDILKDLKQNDMDLDKFKAIIQSRSNVPYPGGHGGGGYLSTRMASFLNVLIRAYADAQDISYVKVMEELLGEELFEDGYNVFVLRKSYGHGIEIAGELPKDYVLMIDTPSEETI